MKYWKDIEKKVMSWKIEPGDFVNLWNQYGDVWSQVEENAGDLIIIYKHGGKDQKTTTVSASSIKKLCRKENMYKIKTCYIITDKEKIKRKYPMDADAYGFQGDEHI